MSPIRRRPGLAALRRSACSPNSDSRVRGERRAPVPHDRATAARPSPSVCRSPPDQLAPPTQQLRWTHRKSRPAAPRWRPGERGKSRPNHGGRTGARRGCRRRIVSSCRSTRISSSFECSRLPSSPPTEAADTARDTPTTSPPEPPKLWKCEAIDLRADVALRARAEFLNPMSSGKTVTRVPVDGETYS
jgi:hypothetical protein